MPTKVESPRESVMSVRKAGTNGIARNKSEEFVYVASFASGRLISLS